MICMRKNEMFKVLFVAPALTDETMDTRCVVGRLVIRDESCDCEVENDARKESLNDKQESRMREIRQIGEQKKVVVVGSGT